VTVWAETKEVLRLIASTITYPDDVMELERKDVSTDRVAASVSGLEKDHLAHRFWNLLPTHPLDSEGTLERELSRREVEFR
jgi:hypothetical protein